MELKNFLSSHQKYISTQWTEAIIRTYPEEGAKFFGATSNQFANPVGHTFRNNIERIVIALAQGTDISECRQELDGIIRIRAVQGFTPTQALSFIPALKEIVYQKINKTIPAETMSTMVYDINKITDALMFLGFDLYMQCRETLWKQKANELYNRTHKLLERAKLITDEQTAG